MKKWLIIFFILISLKGLSTNYYFEAAGNDGNAGTSPGAGNAWQTISKVNSAMPSMSPGDSILFKRGETFYGSIVIGRSGTFADRIVLGAYGIGSRPIISGLQTLTWTSLGSNIWESVETVNVPYLYTVLVDGLPTAMGRWPNANTSNGGYLKLDSYTWNSSTKIGTISDGGFASAPTSNWKGADIVDKKLRWVIDADTVTSQTGNTITFHAKSNQYSPKNGYGIFIQRHPKTLDQNGEWYFNDTTQKVRMFYVGTPPTTKVAAISKLIEATTKSYYTIDNLNLQGANDYGIYTVTGGQYVTIKNCEIEYIGNAGFKSTASNIFILNNIISDCYNYSIDAGTASNTGITITGNSISNIGLFPGFGAAGDNARVGIITRGGNTLVQNNVIRKTGYHGVKGSEHDTIAIKYNKFDSIGTITSDLGAIYFVNNQTSDSSTGRKIIGNLIMNVLGSVDGTTDATATLAAGIYLDLNTEGIDSLYGNTTMNTSRGFKNNQGTRRINFQNNNIYNSRLTGFEDALGDSADRVQRDNVIRNNVFVALDNTQLSATYTTSDVTYKPLIYFGNINYNYYIRVTGTARHIKIRTGSDSLGRWKSLYPQYDTNSVESPYRHLPLVFVFNPNPVDTNITFSTTHVDLAGTTYSNITLAPYASKVLYNTSTVITQFTLSVSVDGSGSITKASNQATYDSATTVLLTAIPDPGFEFIEWQGDAVGTENPISVLMNSNKSVTAVFDTLEYTLTVNAVGDGTVSKDPDQGTYLHGSEVTLTATPADGMYFIGWSGNAGGNTNPLTILMDDNKTITATFGDMPPAQKLRGRYRVKQ